MVFDDCLQSVQIKDSPGIEDFNIKIEVSGLIFIAFFLKGLTVNGKRCRMPAALYFRSYYRRIQYFDLPDRHGGYRSRAREYFRNRKRIRHHPDVQSRNEGNR